MRDYARKAIILLQGKQPEDLDKDEVLCLALTHLVELVGEAAAQVPPDVRAQYAQLPWPQIIGMRHHLIHGYDIVDYGILWDTIKHDLPALLDELEQIIAKGFGDLAV